MKIDWDEFDVVVCISAFVVGYTCCVFKDMFDHWQWNLDFTEFLSGASLAGTSLYSGHAIDLEDGKKRVEEALRLDTMAYRE